MHSQSGNGMRQCCGQHHHQAVCLVLGVAYTVAINTDCQHLAVAEAGTKAFLGKKLTKSLGVGDPPEVERKAAESAKGLLEDVLKGANMAFRHSRRGGGTVTGAAPVVARIAMEQGYIVVGVVTTPSRVERARMLVAEGGIGNMRAKADTIIIGSNRLLDMMSDLPLERIFQAVDKLIVEIIKGLRRHNGAIPHQRSSSGYR